MPEQKSIDPKVEILFGWYKYTIEFEHRVDFLFERQIEHLGTSLHLAHVHLYTRSSPISYGDIVPQGMFERVFSDCYDTENVDKEKTAPLKGALELAIKRYLEGKWEREYGNPSIDMQALASGRTIERYDDTVKVDYAAAKMLFNQNNLIITSGRKIQRTMDFKKPYHRIKQ